MTKKVEAARDTQRATPPEGERMRVITEQELNEGVYKAMDERKEEIYNAWEEIAERWKDFEPTMENLITAIHLTMQPILKAVGKWQYDMEQLKETFKMWSILAPFMEEETKAHPEIYGDEEHPDVGEDVPMAVLIAAAAKRARAAGVDIPEEWTEAGDTEGAEMIAGADAKIHTIPMYNNALSTIHLSPNARLVNLLQEKFSKDSEGKDVHPIINAGEVDLIVSQKGSIYQKKISVSVTFEAEDGTPLKGRGSTEYERSIYDTVASIFEARGKNYPFTADMVYREMNHNANAKLSPQQRGAITKVIEKWRSAKFYVDATEEITAHFKKRHLIIPEGTTFVWDDYALSLRRIQIKNKNNVQWVYYFNTTPLLLDYSKSTGKLLSSPSDLLDVKELDAKGRITDVSIANTEGRTAIKNYLWRRVLIIKRDTKDARERYRKYEAERKKKPELNLPARPLAHFYRQSHKILFSTLFEATDQGDMSREMQRRNRDYVFQILDYWKAYQPTPFIQDYEVTTGPRNAITGIEIEA